MAWSIFGAEARGTPVLVIPQQLRHATSEELMAVEHADELDRLLVHGENQYDLKQ